MSLQPLCCITLNLFCIQQIPSLAPRPFVHRRAPTVSMARRADDEALPSAALMQLDELSREDVGRCVRVLGRIARIDAAARTLDLEYRGARLLVDTTRIDGALSVSDYRHVLGEVRVQDGAPNGIALRARLLVAMEGVDVDLYDRCLALRRRLEERLFPDDDRN